MNAAGRMPERFLRHVIAALLLVAGAKLIA